MAISPSSPTTGGRRGALTTMYRQDAAKNEVPTSSSIARAAATGNSRLTNSAVTAAASNPPRPATGGGGTQSGGFWEGPGPTKVAAPNSGGISSNPGGTGMGAYRQQAGIIGSPQGGGYGAPPPWNPGLGRDAPIPAQQQQQMIGPPQRGGVDTGYSVPTQPGQGGIGPEWLDFYRNQPQPQQGRNEAEIIKQRQMTDMQAGATRGIRPNGQPSLTWGIPPQAGMDKPGQSYSRPQQQAPMQQTYQPQASVWDRPQQPDGQPYQQPYNPWAAQQGQPSTLWAQQQGRPGYGRSADIDYGAPRNMPQMQAGREMAQAGQQAGQMQRRASIPMFAYGTGQQAYNQAGMGGQWIPSSQNSYAQGKQIPPMMQRLIDQGMPIPPALLNSVTGGQNGPLNMAAAFTARGGGSMPSMQGYNNMSLDEREAFGGYLTGPIGMPEASTMDSISRPTQNLQKAPVSRI